MNSYSIGKGSRYWNREILFFSFFSYVTSRLDVIKYFFIRSYLLLQILQFFFHLYPRNFFPSHGIKRLIIWISVILNLVVSVIYRFSKTRLKFDGFSVTTLLLRLQRYSPNLERNWEKRRGGGAGRAVVGKPCTLHDLFILETEGPAIREGKYFLDGLGLGEPGPPTLWLSP